MSMLTEAEAKTRWCPFARVLHVGDSGIQQYPNNRLSTSGASVNANPEDCRCIGSACMAWRRHESAAFKSKAEHEFRTTGKRIKTNEGYCGLASRPEAS